jgi:hypothetical protein
MDLNSWGKVHVGSAHISIPVEEESIRFQKQIVIQVVDWPVCFIRECLSGYGCGLVAEVPDIS